MKFSHILHTVGSIYGIYRPFKCQMCVCALMYNCPNLEIRNLFVLMIYSWIIFKNNYLPILLRSRWSVKWTEYVSMENVRYDGEKKKKMPMYMAQNEKRMSGKRRRGRSKKNVFIERTQILFHGNDINLIDIKTNVYTNWKLL